MKKQSLFLPLPALLMLPAPADLRPTVSTGFAANSTRNSKKWRRPLF